MPQARGVERDHVNIDAAKQRAVIIGARIASLGREFEASEAGNC